MKILLLDIETAPIIASVWRIWDQNISLGQIKSDWHLLSFAAKWLGEKRVIYQDQSSTFAIENDRKLLVSIHKLLNEAEVVIGHHGKNSTCRRSTPGSSPVALSRRRLTKSSTLARLLPGIFASRPISWNFCPGYFVKRRRLRTASSPASSCGKSAWPAIRKRGQRCGDIIFATWRH